MSQATQDFFVITGASRGIGAGMLKAAHGQGATVLAIARNAVATQERLHSLSADLSQESQIQQAAQAILTTTKTVQPKRLVLINNAAMLDPVGMSDTLHTAPLDQHFRVNVTAPMVLASAALQLARKGLPTVVLNISSGAGKRPIAGWAAYCTAKAALEMATRTLATDAAQLQAPLTAIALGPGVVDTAMQAHIRVQDQHVFPDVQRFVALKEQQQLRDADEVGASIVQWLVRGTLQNGASLSIDDVLSQLG